MTKRMISLVQSTSPGVMPSTSQASAHGAIRARSKRRAMYPRRRPTDRGSGRAISRTFLLRLLGRSAYSIVGIEKAAPSLMPEGQRAVTVFVRV